MTIVLSGTSYTLFACIWICAAAVPLSAFAGWKVAADDPVRERARETLENVTRVKVFSIQMSAKSAAAASALWKGLN